MAISVLAWKNPIIRGSLVGFPDPLGWCKSGHELKSRVRAVGGGNGGETTIYEAVFDVNKDNTCDLSGFIFLLFTASLLLLAMRLNVLNSI